MGPGADARLRGDRRRLRRRRGDRGRHSCRECSFRRRRHECSIHVSAHRRWLAFRPEADGERPRAGRRLRLTARVRRHHARDRVCRWQWFGLRVRQDPSRLGSTPGARGEWGHRSGPLGRLRRCTRRPSHRHDAGIDEGGCSGGLPTCGRSLERSNQAHPAERDRWGSVWRCGRHLGNHRFCGRFSTRSTRERLRVHAERSNVESVGRARRERSEPNPSVLRVVPRGVGGNSGGGRARAAGQAG